MTRKVGWRPTPMGQGEDRSADRHLGAGPVPKESDLVRFTRVIDQLNLSSCVGNTVADAVWGKMVMKGAVNPPLPSRLAIYYLARAAAKEQHQDAGAYIHLAFAMLNRFGFCPEDLWPYTDQGDRWAQMPPSDAFWGSFDQKEPTDYRRIMTTGGARVDDVKRALGSGHLVVFGTDVTSDFCSGNLGPTGIAQAPGPGDQIAGGHAMLWCGHKPESVRGLTSWGTGVFDGGYFDMSWDYVEADCTRDIWLVADCPIYSGAS